MHLYRAATLLTHPKLAAESQKSVDQGQIESEKLPFPSSSRLLFEARAISLKAQVRLSATSPEFNLKHQLCRRCSTPVIKPPRPGEEHFSTQEEHVDKEPRDETQAMAAATFDMYVENASKNGRKDRADVKVLKCRACGVEKRLPVGIKRQQKPRDRKHVRSRRVAALEKFPETTGNNNYEAHRIDSTRTKGE